VLDVPDFGGDDACWLDRVCPECGLVLERTEHVCDQRRAGSLSSTTLPDGSLTND
jgi:hypothetical protein